MGSHSASVDEERHNNVFDYQIRESLKKKCKEMKVRLSEDCIDHIVLLDVITLVSDGDKDAAVKNLQETVNFMSNYRTAINRLLDASPHAPMNIENYLDDLYWNLIYCFWKTYFIKVLVSHRRKIKPKYKPHESLRRSQFFVNHTSTIYQFLSASRKEEKRLLKMQKDLDLEYQRKATSLLSEEGALRADIVFE